MAELNLSSGKTGGKHLSKKMPVRVDLTAMVDLAFLLITFFMLTTSLTKHREMPVVMPAPGPPGAVGESSTLTICLGKNNQALYYLGMADKPLTTPKLSAYGSSLHNVILNMSKKVLASAGKNMMVIVKPAQHSVYANLVDALDEVNLAQIQSYAIGPISAKDIELLKQSGVY